MPTYLLLQNGPDMSVGGVGGESEDRPGQGVRQRNGGDECFFCRGESSLHLRRPGEGLGVTCECGGERTERPSGPGEETAVEVHHTQKALKSFAISGSREIQNDLNVVSEGGDAGGGDAVAQEVQLGDGEDALLQVEGQAVGGEDGEQRAEVGPVLLLGLAEDTVII